MSENNIHRYFYIVINNITYVHISVLLKISEHSLKLIFSLQAPPAQMNSANTQYKIKKTFNAFLHLKRKEIK